MGASAWAALIVGIAGVVTSVVIWLAPTPSPATKKWSVGVLSTTVLVVLLLATWSSIPGIGGGSSGGKVDSLKLNPYAPYGSASFTQEGDVYTASFKDLRWAGYRAGLPNLKSYRIEFRARLNRPAKTPPYGAGWGYGLGVCTDVSSSAPRGVSMQYAFFQDTSAVVSGLEEVYLPKANTFPEAVAQPLDPIDYSWHTWTIKVKDDSAAIYYDQDYRVGQIDHLTERDGVLPENCSGRELFLRVWGGSTSFQNVQLIPSP